MGFPSILSSPKNWRPPKGSSSSSTSASTSTSTSTSAKQHQQSLNDKSKFQQKVKKHVTIDESQNKTCETIHINDISNADRDLIWVTAVEFMESKKAYTSIVRMMMRAHNNEPIQETDEICCRGLEFRTKEGSRRRKKIKRTATDAVLMEQDIQRDEGLNDDLWLAEVYREFSGPSALEALNRGLKDQKAMFDLMDPEERFHYDQEKNHIARKQMESSSGGAVAVSASSSSSITIPRRRRSITETLNGNDNPSTHRLVTDLNN